MRTGVSRKKPAPAMALPASVLGQRDECEMEMTMIEQRKKSALSEDMSCLGHSSFYLRLTRRCTYLGRRRCLARGWEKNRR